MSSSKEAKAYIIYLNKNKDYLKTINFEKDSYSIREDMRRFLIENRGFNPEDLGDFQDSDMKHAWFHDDDKEFIESMKSVSDSNLRQFKASPNLTKSAKQLVDSDVKIEVVADRVIGLKNDNSADTEIWMAINGISQKNKLDGEPSVYIMVDPTEGDHTTAESMRTHYVPENKPMDEDERLAFSKCGYASIH
jgi:hypothetical protein